MLSDEDFRKLLNDLDRPWAGYRKVRKGVKKRVRRHMLALHCSTIEEYLSKIDQDAAVRAECEHHLAVTISRFFRDRMLWDHLYRNILPDLASWFPEGIKAWSAGCANGEEPYSLSMIWEAVGKPCEMKILATDANPVCLQRALNRRYPESSLKEVSEGFRRRWFQGLPGKKQCEINANLEKRIHWQTHQLLDEPPAGKFHLILLRNNLLTYYQGYRMQNAFQRIVDRLIEGGILIVGSHERLPPSNPPLERDISCHWVYWVQPLRS